MAPEHPRRHDRSLTPYPDAPFPSPSLRSPVDVQWSCIPHVDVPETCLKQRYRYPPTRLPGQIHHNAIVPINPDGLAGDDSSAQQTADQGSNPPAECLADLGRVETTDPDRDQPMQPRSGVSVAVDYARYENRDASGIARGNRGPH
jgi:hypothetical protein